MKSVPYDQPGRGRLTNRNAAGGYNAISYNEKDAVVGEPRLRELIPEGCTLLIVKRGKGLRDVYQVTDEWNTPLEAPFYLSKYVACALGRKVWDGNTRNGVEVYNGETSPGDFVRVISLRIHGDTHSLRGWEI